jgi:hypothetical protein
VNASEILCLAYLESLEGVRAIPRDFSDGEPANQALVEEFGGVWHLTARGHRHLANLRSVLDSN